MKKVLALVMAVVLIFGAAGCGSTKTADSSVSSTTTSTAAGSASESSKPAEPVKLTFWTLALQPTFTDFINGLLDKYKAENTNVTIVWQDLPYDAIQQKVLTSTAADNSPDVVNIWSQLALTLAGKGALLDLEKVATPEQKDIYAESMYESARLGEGVYAFPWYSTPNITSYNTELFKKAGFEKPPQTYDEELDMAKAFKEKTGAFIDTPSSMYHMFCYYNIPLVSADKKKAAFNTPEAVALVTKLQKAGLEGAIPTSKWDDWDNMRQLFANNKVAMIVAGPQTVTRIKTESPTAYQKMAVSTPVLGPSGKSGAAIMNLVVPAKSKNPTEAVKFANFISNDENQLAFCKIVSIFPTTKKAAADPFFKSDMNSLEGQANYYASLSSLASSDLTMGLPNDDEVKKEIDNITDAIFARKTDPQTAIANAEKKVNELLSKNQ
ncbi:ABC transporter substrate-binding protein [Ruminiclostridium cellobioparum]|uniref:ABC-type sugar transport system, periplasmic component n=1 Tax=Ruminiclostridium cellobioparum subsp. termitidis CT1112 TaxID=1195236 RepID=S0FTE1_RUMCE|nr:sugar ABC transporter substrate-binding protein [Ruminiclostridium cellobioparum]EMS72434.1 ABC-type sugar transport system, periplasmic component [Ruminiclostridium cellobioparum subsp. termitidis CT1112]